MPHHDSIDLKRWNDLFPLDALSPPSWNDVKSIAGPKSFALNSQLQQILTDTQHLPDGFPADVCCWNVGECSTRHLTKTGGLPYIPIDFEWPTFDDVPLVFYGQFCFADSTDVVGDLPGDVLLVFGQPPGEYPGFYTFEWLPMGLSNLASLGDLPETPRQFKPCYASMLRTTDYETHRPLASDTTEEDGYDLDRTTYPMFFHGTKIGGVSTIVIGDYPEDIKPWEPPGRFICQLDSLGRRSPGSWPFLNLERGDWVGDSNAGFMELTGNGTLFLYLDDDGDIHEEIYFS